MQANVWSKTLNWQCYATPPWLVFSGTGRILQVSTEWAERRCWCTCLQLWLLMSPRLSAPQQGQEIMITLNQHLMAKLILNLSLMVNTTPMPRNLWHYVKCVTALMSQMFLICKRSGHQVVQHLDSSTTKQSCCKSFSMQFYIVLPKYAQTSLDDTSSGWEHMLL